MRTCCLLFVIPLGILVPALELLPFSEIPSVCSLLVFPPSPGVILFYPPLLDFILFAFFHSPLAGSYLSSLLAAVAAPAFVFSLLSLTHHLPL